MRRRRAARATLPAPNRPDAGDLGARRELETALRRARGQADTRDVPTPDDSNRSVAQRLPPHALRRETSRLAHTNRARLPADLEPLRGASQSRSPISNPSICSSEQNEQPVARVSQRRGHVDNDSLPPAISRRRVDGERGREESSELARSHSSRKESSSSPLRRFGRLWPLVTGLTHRLLETRRPAACCSIVPRRVPTARTEIIRVSLLVGTRVTTSGLSSPCRAISVPPSLPSTSRTPRNRGRGCSEDESRVVLAGRRRRRPIVGRRPCSEIAAHPRL